MSRTTRRRFLTAAALGAAGVAALRWYAPRWMRAGPVREPGPEAAKLVERYFQGIDLSRVWDIHVHLVGLGSGGTGCSVNPKMLQHRHPILRFQYDAYSAGAGMRDESTADADYLARLLELHRAANPLGKLVLLAFDRHVDERGIERPERSPFYTPNEYPLRLALTHRDIVAGASVHPYREDALDRLDQALDGGARLVKWLPNAMGIDPADSRCVPFYRRLAQRGVPLLTHAGKEFAVDSGGSQELGSPLRLRRALDEGVTVIVAHCGSLGWFPDADDPAQESLRSFDLFWRLFTDPRYERNLYADISTLTHVHHSMEQARRLLRAPELHRRLLYASDYPICSLRGMVSTWRLVRGGLLDAADRPGLNELFEANPLLFDLVLNRALRVIEGGKTYRFAPDVFHTDRMFGGNVSPSPGRFFVS